MSWADVGAGGYRLSSMRRARSARQRTRCRRRGSLWLRGHTTSRAASALPGATERSRACARAARPHPHALRPAARSIPTTYARGHRLFEAALRPARADHRLAGAPAAPARPAPGAVGALGGLRRRLGRRARWPAGAARRAPGRAGLDRRRPARAERGGFLARFEALPAPAPRARGHACRFADLPVGAPTTGVRRGDVRALAVLRRRPRRHARRALGRLAPGGELLVLHAPLGALNRLTATLRPPGRRPPAAVEPRGGGRARSAAGRRAPHRARATVDLTGIAEDDPALLEFVVQAPPRRRTRAARPSPASTRSPRPAPALRVPHPVTAYRITPR